MPKSNQSGTTKPLPTPKSRVSSPLTNPSRIPGRATKPTYQRSNVEKAVDEIGKAVRRVPSDISKGVDVVKGAANTLRERARKLKK